MMKIVGLAVGILMVVGALLLIFDVLPKEKTPNAGPPPETPPMMMSATPFITPAIVRPTAVPAKEASLKDDEEIIGVFVDGKPRAYRLGAFRGPLNHVVNDVVGNTPVSVTYCNELNCIRVFTSDGKGPLIVQTGGFKDGMLLYIAGKFYAQHDRQPLHEGTAPFPYEALEYERTTWGKWRMRHPTTDVYEHPPTPKKD